MNQESKKRIYPFTRDVERKLVFNWRESILPRLFGMKYHEYDGIYEIVAYYYKGKMYITKFDKLIEG